jgi:hypothetical protein
MNFFYTGPILARSRYGWPRTAPTLSDAISNVMANINKAHSPPFPSQQAGAHLEAI